MSHASHVFFSDESDGGGGVAGACFRGGACSQLESHPGACETTPSTASTMMEPIKVARKPYRSIVAKKSKEARIAFAMGIPLPNLSSSEVTPFVTCDGGSGSAVPGPLASAAPFAMVVACGAVSSFVSEESAVYFSGSFF